MTRKAYLLFDALFIIMIIAILSSSVLMLYRSVNNYERGYINYREASNERLEYAFKEIRPCVKEDSAS